MDLLLRGGVLHDPSSCQQGQEVELLIRNGRVEAISHSIGPVDLPVLDLSGKLLLPGMIDMHVHLREPGGEHKETIASGSAAAVAGGFTGVACMPNTSPAADSRETLMYIKEQAARADLAHVYPIAAITKGLKGQELTPMEELAAAGARGFSDDGRPVTDSALMLRALQFARVLGLPVLSHAEDLSLAAAGVVHAGATGSRLGLPVIPAAAETVTVARDLLLQQQAGASLHLLHLSSRLSVSLLAWARNEGIDCTAEVTPHHLLLTETAVDNYNTDAKMNPPLRGESDRAALQEALKSGLIDVIATDHAPHHVMEKKQAYLNAPFGVSGLETALPLLFSYLVETKMIALSRLVDSLSATPARILGVPGGTLAPGSIADLVVVDPRSEQQVHKEKFYSKGRNTPFEGWKIRGIPVLTLVQGDIKMCRGEVKGVSPGFNIVVETALREGKL